ncbi:hypothetical protein BVRB_7g179830 isoform B [Beta vulgaris subsp. vulgaris]|uniref:Uncharacterized protein n=1 Tax=Beta vulgaris subsp. vulgaris TaxID=3555 RepID=A0A0J8B7J6_BETVV|nr:uncharacterized protein LOC104908930 isoform X2 [Beta vulgaris subsp. vulgaris]KMS96976.1 hypothetical protein BVRB_7g179830 isoform B [Beta vulgaris subsp. vulgaris]
MELKYSCVFAILIFYLLVTPYIFSAIRNLNDEDVYEIDYRGPETHSRLPPPDRMKRGPPYIHHKAVTKFEQRPANMIRKHAK